MGYFGELFINILGLFLKVKIQNWIFFFGGGGGEEGVANFQLFSRVYLILLIFFYHYFFFFFWGGGRVGEQLMVGPCLRSMEN